MSCLWGWPQPRRFLDTTHSSRSSPPPFRRTPRRDVGASPNGRSKRGGTQSERGRAGGDAGLTVAKTGTSLQYRMPTACRENAPCDHGWPGLLLHVRPPARLNPAQAAVALYPSTGRAHTAVSMSKGGRSFLQQVLRQLSHIAPPDTARKHTRGALSLSRGWCSWCGHIRDSVGPPIYIAAPTNIPPSLRVTTTSTPPTCHPSHVSRSEASLTREMFARL